MAAPSQHIELLTNWVGEFVFPGDVVTTRVRILEKEEGVDTYSVEFLQASRLELPPRFVQMDSLRPLPPPDPPGTSFGQYEVVDVRLGGLAWFTSLTLSPQRNGRIKVLVITLREVKTVQVSDVRRHKFFGWGRQWRSLDPPLVSRL